MLKGRRVLGEKSFMAGKEKKEDFEGDLKKLQKIVGILESGDTSLEESVKQFEQGMKLAKSCQDRLTQAEQKVSKLIKLNKSSVETEPL